MTAATATIGLSLLGLAVLRAGVRGSADYTVAAETFDCAGEAAASQNYHNQPSLGGSGGAAAVAETTALAPGYIAQLAPAAALALTAPAGAVDENSTLRLSAWEILTDGTRVGLPAAAVAWTSASGPLTADGSGMITGGPVYQDSAATVRAAFGGLSTTLPLAVFNATADNFGGYAGDGLPDDWQARYFGPANPLAAPAQDPDHDGHPNAFEWAARLDPTDPASRFSLTIQPVPGRPQQRQLVFGPRYDGPAYAVAAASGPGSWAPLASSTTTDSGNWRAVTDLAAIEPAKLYRVGVTATTGEFSYADDGVADDWQLHYFGLANPAAAPAADPDGDGQDNTFEFAARLDPTRAASRFSLTIKPVPGHPDRRLLSFGPCVAGAVHTVLASSDLRDWSPLAAATTSTAGDQRSVTDLAATGAEKFYRVAVVGSGLGFSYANDSLPDDWQAIHFGSASPDAGPTQDPDGDGQSNEFEYAAGLDPNDPSSRLVLTIAAVPNQPTQRRITFSPRYEGTGYPVESSTDFATWSPLTLFTVADTGLVRAVTDLAAGGAIRFYRVSVIRP